MLITKTENAQVEFGTYYIAGKSTMATTNREMTDNPIVHRIVNLIEEQGKKERDLTDYLGISPGTMSKWKYDGSNVYLKYIEGICEYLETTPNYLFYGKDEEGRLSPAEKDMIRIYRKLDSGRKKCVRDTLKYFEYGIDDKEQ